MELRAQLEDEVGATFIIGDFNKRSVETQLECDPHERSDPFHWYEVLTASSEGRNYVDAVRRYARKLGRSLGNQWTHEQRNRTPLCNGTNELPPQPDRLHLRFRRRSCRSIGRRAGLGRRRDPGRRAASTSIRTTGSCAARYVLTGPPQPLRPQAIRKRGGEVDLTWSPVEGAEGYVVYRAIRRRTFDTLANVGAETTAFNDLFTEHGVTYRYKIAAVGADEGQGVESGASFVEIDKRGPQVLYVFPRRGAIDVERRENIRVTFDEAVRPDSVTNDRIRLYRGRTRLSGTLRQVSPRVLVFNPTFPMRAGREHKVSVKPVTDRLRNVGGGAGWTFETRRPRKKN